jgi:hypothetical protein
MGFEEEDVSLVTLSDAYFPPALHTPPFVIGGLPSTKTTQETTMPMDQNIQYSCFG